jgi:hypothetical protein
LHYTVRDNVLKWLHRATGTCRSKPSGRHPPQSPPCSCLLCLATPTWPPSVSSPPQRFWPAGRPVRSCSGRFHRNLCGVHTRCGWEGDEFAACMPVRCSKACSRPTNAWGAHPAQAPSPLRGRRCRGPAASCRLRSGAPQSWCAACTCGGTDETPNFSNAAESSHAHTTRLREIFGNLLINSLPGARHRVAALRPLARRRRAAELERHRQG